MNPRAREKGLLPVTRGTFSFTRVSSFSFPSRVVQHHQYPPCPSRFRRLLIPPLDDIVLSSPQELEQRLDSMLIESITITIAMIKWMKVIMGSNGIEMRLAKFPISDRVVQLESGRKASNCIEIEANWKAPNTTFIDLPPMNISKLDFTSAAKSRQFQCFQFCSVANWRAID